MTGLRPTFSYPQLLRRRRRPPHAVYSLSETNLTSPRRLQRVHLLRRIRNSPLLDCYTA